MSSRHLLFILLMLNFSCKEKTYSQGTETNKNSIVNCYIIKPVQNDSKADTLRDFEFTKEHMGDILAHVISSKRTFVYDSTMDSVTSFEKQKLIPVNNECYKKLSKPDSCYLMELYFSSGYKTKNMTRSIVEFHQSYKKNIFNLGNSTIFEYEFNGVAEVESHFMYIILKEQTEDEQRSGMDYKGFVIYSDGLDWKDYGDKGFSIPLFKQMVRRSKEFYIPLHYDGERFIPIGHFKSSNWQE